MNRLRQFDWMREEINPEVTTGITAGNQAGASARKESTSTRPKSFTGGMSGGGPGPESVTPRLAALAPGLALDPDDLNLYAYLANNPFAGTDPDGCGAIWDKVKQVAKGAFSIVTGETSAGDLVRAAPGAAVDAVKASAQWMDQHPRVGGVLQTAGGITEMAGGLAGAGLAGWTGIGAVGGGLLMAHGADNLVAGVRTLATGQAHTTLTQKALEGASESLTGTKSYGTIATIGLDLVASGLAARSLAKAGGLLGTETIASGRVTRELDVDGFRLAKHGDMPTPRAGAESHHGAMSRWMAEHFLGYDPDKAPAVLMPKQSHDATRGVYNTWRAEMRRQMGGKFEWSRVAEEQIRELSVKMFRASRTPESIQEAYWRWFERMKQALERQGVASGTP